MPYITTVNESRNAIAYAAQKVLIASLAVVFFSVLHLRGLDVNAFGEGLDFTSKESRVPPAAAPPAHDSPRSCKPSFGRKIPRRARLKRRFRLAVRVRSSSQRKPSICFWSTSVSKFLRSASVAGATTSTVIFASLSAIRGSRTRAASDGS